VLNRHGVTLDQGSGIAKWEACQRRLMYICGHLGIGINSETLEHLAPAAITNDAV
jgi:hypothetical protein